LVEYLNGHGGVIANAHGETQVVAVFGLEKIALDEGIGYEVPFVPQPPGVVPFKLSVAVAPPLLGSDVTLNALDAAAPVDAGIQDRDACVAIGLPVGEILGSAKERRLPSEAVHVKIEDGIIASAEVVVAIENPILGAVSSYPPKVKRHGIAVGQDEDFLAGIACGDFTDKLDPIVFSLHYPT
jgi:hypothetical protein